MADEPRRSGRATKGQHKNLDMPEPPPSKRKGKAGKAAKQAQNEPTPPAEEEEEEDIIRCICGEYEEEEDVERDMICCDKCSAWQHNDCMGLNFAKGQEPEQYFCEQCKPEDHKELLAKMVRGEKPWEEAAKKRAQAAAERKGRRKKGGKRGRKSKANDIKPEMSDVASASATPMRGASESQNGAAPVAPQQGPSSTQKRKFEEQGQHQEPGPQPKLQRLSTGAQASASASPHERKKSPLQSRKPSMASPATGMSPTEPLSLGMGHLPPNRRHAANAMARLFTDQAGIAEEKGTFSIPPDQTKQSVGESLGLAVEHAMYKNISGGTGEPNEAYRQQMRTILFNVRKNPLLRDSLLVGRISPDAFSKMTTQDMASEELRQRDDEIKREAERQHIIIQEKGPRIRRTHKGEEIVEEDPQVVGNESVFSTAPARRDTLPDTAMSPRATSPSVAQQPEFKPYSGAVDGGQQKQPHPIDTGAGSPGGHRRSTGSDFNIQNVWSSVQSPGAGHGEQQFGPASSYREHHPPPGTHQTPHDPEIDQLLKDDEAESPPYSPKDFSGPNAVWRGKVSMNAVADFSATARFVGGADLSGRIPWPQLVPPTLAIDGRIGIQLACNYLCGLRYSQSTDVSIIAIPAPEMPDDIVQYNGLFDYFVSRKRYGVIGKHPNPAVKDTYVVPVEAGAGKKPEFVELLENNSVEDPNPERLLLVVFVVKTSHPNTPSGLAAPQSITPTGHSTTPDTAQPQNQTDPSAPTAPQQPAQPQQPTQSQAQDQDQGHYSPPPPTQPTQPSDPSLPPAPTAAATVPVPPIPQPHPQIQTSTLTGKPAAIQVLGEELASYPVIEEVLRHAPNIDVIQLTVIAGIISRNPAAANNYAALMNALVQESTNGNGNGNAGGGGGGDINMGGM